MLEEIREFFDPSLIDRMTVALDFSLLGLLMAMIAGREWPDRSLSVSVAVVAGVVATISAVQVVLNASSWDGLVAANGLMTIFLALPYCRRKRCEPS